MNFVPDASVRRLEGWAGSDGTAVTQHHRRLHPGAQIAQTTKAARMLTRASREGRWHQTVKRENGTRPLSSGSTENRPAYIATAVGNYKSALRHRLRMPLENSV